MVSSAQSVSADSARERSVEAGSPAEWMPSALQAHRERLTLTVITGAITAIFAAFATLQAVFIHGMGLGDVGHPNPGGLVVPRLVVNGICVVVVVALARFGGVERRRPAAQFALIVAFAALSGAFRVGLQIVFDVYGGVPLGPLLVDFVMASVVVVVAFALALGVVVLQRRLHEREQAFVEQRVRASAALAALQGEELRVRREVSEGLHGTVQQRLVLIGARLASLARDLDEAPDISTARLVGRHIEALASEVDELREVEVRELSQLLYPAGIEFGLAQAVRMMMRKVPATIATRVEVDDSVLAVDGSEGSPLTPAGRLLLVRILEEAVSNALRHGHAAQLAVRLAALDGVMHLVFEDDGLGLPDPAPRLNGLGLLCDRLRQHGGTLTLTPRTAGGARLEAILPL